MKLSELQNLDPKNIGSWPAVIRALVVLILCAAVLGAGYYFDTKDQMVSLERVEATEQAQDQWVDYVAEVSQETLMSQANSWYVGANIPGRPRVFMPYTGGVPAYLERCAQVVADNYAGFAFS